MPNLSQEPSLNKLGPLPTDAHSFHFNYMLIKPFLIVIIVMLTCCKNYSSVLNFTYSEQLQFSHNTSRKAPKLYVEVIIAKLWQSIALCDRMLRHQISRRIWSPSKS